MSFYGQSYESAVINIIYKSFIHCKPIRRLVMGFRFRKSIKLGKGIRLNVSKRGVGISGGMKGFRVGVGPRGVRTTTSIPGTGISYVKEKSFKGNKQNKEKPRIDVQSKASYSSYLPQEVPKELKSNQYHLQSILGFIGIAFIFGSFKSLGFFVIGIFLIYAKGVWRKRTDIVTKNYRDAVNYYKTHKYHQCIEAINQVLTDSRASQDLLLVQAECYLELDQIDKAYEIYQKYFQRVHPASLSPLDYWTPMANAIAIALDKKDDDFALMLTEVLPEDEIQDIDFSLWKNFFKGHCFIIKEQYDAAVEAFKKAIGRKRRMHEPYIDCHYYMAIAYAKLGKNSLAHQHFQRVYAAKSNYKNISAIIEAIASEKDLHELIEEGLK